MPKDKKKGGKKKKDEAKDAKDKGDEKRKDLEVPIALGKETSLQQEYVRHFVWHIDIQVSVID